MSNFLTPACYQNIVSEIDNIKNEQMPAIAEEISIARSHGDLRENAQYASAKEKQRMIESRLNELETVIATHTVVDISNKKFATVSFGCNVEIEFNDNKTKKAFQILSDYDSDVSKSIVSINAPIAKAILGLSKGDDAVIVLNGVGRDVIITNIF